jgi:hypothetical protein
VDTGESHSRLLLLPTPLGIALLIAGLSVVSSPHLVFLILAGAALIFALVIFVAWLLRRRSGRPVQLTPAEESSDWQHFMANRRRWAPWESAIFVVIEGVFIWVDGLTLGTILMAAGFACLLVSRWLIEPRTWAEVTRRLTPRT